jgi:hypothetical protein
MNLNLDFESLPNNLKWGKSCKTIKNASGTVFPGFMEKEKAKKIFIVIVFYSCLEYDHNCFFR